MRETPIGWRCCAYSSGLISMGSKGGIIPSHPAMFSKQNPSPLKIKWKEKKCFSFTLSNLHHSSLPQEHHSSFLCLVLTSREKRGRKVFVSREQFIFCLRCPGKDAKEVVPNHYNRLILKPSPLSSEMLIWFLNYVCAQKNTWKIVSREAFTPEDNPCCSQSFLKSIQEINTTGRVLKGNPVCMTTAPFDF